MATVEIEEKEYLSLMNRLEALEKAVGNDAKSIPAFFTLVKNKPYSYIRPVKDDVPEFRFSHVPSSDAWGAFLALAKSYLRENDRFYMGETPVNGFLTRKYIRSTTSDKVRVIAKAPIEKQLLAAQMVSEMVDVYNRYYVEAHKEAIYKPSPNEDPIIVKAIYDPREV